MAKQALGKGLGALISTPAGASAVNPRAPTLSQPAPGDVVRRIALDQIVPSPLQPRKSFTPEHLSELMDSIREHGIIQRRWRAARELRLKEVPLIIREASDRDVLEMALIENLQREGLNPIEEAEAYARLSKDFNMRQEDIAQRVGKNRATVANAIRLLELPSGVRQRLADGEISTGHAKVLLTLKKDGDQTAAADEIVRKGLTVRAAEKLAQQIAKPTPKPAEPTPKESDVLQAIRAVEQRLTRHFSTNVSINHAEKKGRIEIDYYGTEDLNRLLSLMKVEEEPFGG
jgi:ParB family transcriptional regulator, chromosome partitioning protein